MVFAVALPSPPRSDYAPMKQMNWVCRPGTGWQGDRGQRRSGLAASFLPARLPSSLHPASSLRPTNGTSARLCLPQPQTPAKLAGLAAFALKRRGSLLGSFEADMAATPRVPHRTTPLQSGWQAFRQAAVLSRGSLLDQGGQGAWDESLPFSLCGKGWNAIITRLPIK